MAYQITSLIVVYSAVYLGADERKYQSSASLAFVVEIHQPVTGEFPAQMASNAENVDIWWPHYVVMVPEIYHTATWSINGNASFVDSIKKAIALIVIGHFHVQNVEYSR